MYPKFDCSKYIFFGRFMNISEIPEHFKALDQHHENINLDIKELTKGLGTIYQTELNIYVRCLR